MKYQAPAQGHYESCLTARLMYSIVDSLIERHITPEDVKRTNEKYGKPTPEKLWEKPEIRSELEEFIWSYLIGDLPQPVPEIPLPSFEADFMGYGMAVMVKKADFDEYMARLEQHYGSKDKAKDEFNKLFEIIKSRGYWLQDVVDQIGHLKEVKPLIQRNAEDAFRHVAFFYPILEIELRKVLKDP